MKPDYYIKYLILIQIFSFSFNINAQIIESDPDKDPLPEISFYRNDTIRHTITWNAKAYGKYMPRNIGKKQIEAKYYPDGKIDTYIWYTENTAVYSIYKFFYNNKDRLEKIKMFDTQEHLQHQWFLNEKEWIIEEYKYYSNKDIMYAWYYTYDVFGNLTEEIKYNFMGRINKRITFAYDNYNKIVGLSYFKNRGKFNYKWEIRYNENNDTLSCIKYNNKNKELIRYEYYYHKKGQIDSLIISDNKGLSEIKKTWYYNQEKKVISLILNNYKDQNENKYMYGYDSLMQLSEIVYIENLNQINKTVFTYNDEKLTENIQLIKFMGTTEEEILIHETIYTYTEEMLPKEIITKDYLNKTTSVITYEYFKNY